MTNNTFRLAFGGGHLGHYSHDELRQHCLAAGAHGIEGATRLFNHDSLDALQAEGKAWRDAGLEIHTFHLPFATPPGDIAAFYEALRRAAVDDACRWIERAVAVGSRVGIQHPTTVGHNMDDDGFDAYLKPMARSLEKLLPFAESLGFRIAIENMLPAHGGNVRFGSEPEHFERFAREFDHPALGFCLDTGHALVSVGPNRCHEFFDAMGDRIIAFHLADNPGDRDLHLAPGRGLVDFSSAFAHAERIGFDGVMCIEAPPFGHGPAYSAAAWQALVAETHALAQPAAAND